MVTVLMGFCSLAYCAFLCEKLLLHTTWHFESTL